MISKSYAKALYEITKNKGMQDDILNEFRVIEEILKRNMDFKKILDSPIIQAFEKEKIIDRVFGNNVNTILLNFFKLLSRNRLINEIDICFKEFLGLYNMDHGIESAEVISASEINLETKQMLINKLEQITEKKITLNIIIDKSIIGGIVVKYKNIVYDGSIKQKLAVIEKSLKGVG